MAKISYKIDTEGNEIWIYEGTVLVRLIFDYPQTKISINLSTDINLLKNFRHLQARFSYIDKI